MWFGELLVGLNFGILITLGSFYVQTKSFSLDVLIASIPLGILVSAILWINEFPDYNADKKVGKKTLVVRFRQKEGILYINFYTFTTIFDNYLWGDNRVFT